VSKQEDKSGGKRVVINNRRARHEYFIEDTYVAGIVLVGTEVKSLRAGKANMNDAFAKVDKEGEIWLHHFHISPHDEGNRYNVDPIRNRKLLLRKAEINKLIGLMQQKGLTLVPLSLFFERGFAKLELGIGRGKKLYDKRESIAERDRNREAQRQLAER
jgi:SsrA-binding protein